MILSKWAVSSIRGLSMEKISLPFFYQLGTQLNPLTKMNGTDPSKRMDILFNSLSTRESIYYLLKSFSSLTVCKLSAEKLVGAINEVFKWFDTVQSDKVNFPDPLLDMKFSAVIDAAIKFEVVLSEELQTLGAYHVTQKGIYSTPDLISNAEKTLPPSVLVKINDKIKAEIQESGKCLAFDTPTASGFHIIRATEGVLHQFYLTICKPSPEPSSLENWGAYISELKKAGQTDVNEVIALLQQIKDQHRNLIMHPELVLTFDEAYALFEISKSAIIAMASKLPEKTK